MALKIISVHTRVEGSFTATCTGPIATVLSLPHGFQLSFFFLPGMRCGAPVETGVLSLGPMDSMSTKWTVYSSATGRQNGAVFFTISRGFYKSKHFYTETDTIVHSKHFSAYLSLCLPIYKRSHGPNVRIS